jgi:hypothetical protein
MVDSLVPSLNKNASVPSFVVFNDCRGYARRYFPVHLSLHGQNSLRLCVSAVNGRPISKKSQLHLPAAAITIRDAF